MSCEELLFFQNFLFGSSVILRPKVTGVQRLSKIRKHMNMITISFVLQFHPVRHVTGFHRSHHIILSIQPFTMGVGWPKIGCLMEIFIVFLLCTCSIVTAQGLGSYSVCLVQIEEFDITELTNHCLQAGNKQIYI